MHTAGICTDLAELEKPFQDIIEDKVLPDLTAAWKPYGYRPAILETFRIALVQQAYFSQSRESLEIVNHRRKLAGLAPITAEKNKEKITDCDGLKNLSKHQTRRAVDIAPKHLLTGKILWDTTDPKAKEIWQKLGEVCKKHGVKWGGEWGKTASKLGWDCPHVEA